MPIYEYRCTKGHTFEVFQSMSEDSLTVCVECDSPAERVLSAPAVHFKGSGFYTTDYARKGAKKATANEGGGGGEGSSSGDKGSSADKGSKKASDKSSEKSSTSSD